MLYLRVLVSTMKPAAASRFEPASTGPAAQGGDAREDTMGKLEELREYAEMMSTTPTIETMPRRTLADKGIAGPTGAHVVEEVHTPFNFAYITFTTGSTAFQNVVGVVIPEIPGRVAASARALSMAGVRKGEEILVTYPPLVNVFPRQALDEYGVSWSFLKTSSRDALILAMCERKPRVVLGESSFLRATLEDAKKMQLLDLMPRDTIFITAGTPLDLEFPETARHLVNGTVHDLYGCQEFGWLTMDGIPLREDISLIPSGDGGECDFVVGGLPTGDRFPVMDTGHICNREGRIITYSRTRTSPDFETTVLATTAHDRGTVDRLSRTILRIKAKIVRLAPGMKVGAERTVLSLARHGETAPPIVIDGEGMTAMFDSLLTAQLAYQAQSKTDPTWIKGR